MDPLTISSIIGAGASLATGLGSTLSNTNLNRRNRRWQERMFAQQNDEWWKRFNASNEYNSTASQKQRLIDAGLSPSLLYSGSASGAAGSASSPASSDVPATPSSLPEFGDFSGLSRALMALPQNQLALSQADYYGALSDSESGVNRVLRKAQANMNDALSALYVQEKDNATIVGDIYKLQRSLTDLDLRAAQQDWTTGQSVVEVQSPTGEHLIFPIRLAPLYIDYANLYASLLDSRGETELFDERLQSIRNQFQIIAYSLPEEAVSALESSLRLGLLNSDSAEFTVTSDGKTEKVTYSELLRRTIGAEVADEFDELVSRINRVSRKTKFDKGLDVFDRIMHGASIGVQAYGSRSMSRAISSRPAPVGYRQTRIRSDRKGRPVYSDEVMHVPVSF